jgi:hypothetical protein
MSQRFNPSIYRTHDAQSSSPDPNTIPGSMQRVYDCSKRLQTHAHDHNNWLERAGFFLRLNYPELAASDAYKASLLLDRIPNASRRPNFDATTLEVYEVLGQALYDCHCHWELAEIWEGVSARFSSEHVTEKAARIRNLLNSKAAAADSLGGTPQEQKDRLRDGGVIAVDYPWLEARLSVRTQGLIDTVNDELSRNVEQQTCHLAQSTISSHGDMLGMFAARDIRLGEGILLDRTATGACSNIDTDACSNCFAGITQKPIHTACCATKYCSSECRDLALATYHIPICGQDFSWLQISATGLTHNASPLRPLLMLRFIATCVQAGPDAHPLNHPLIARLQPLSNRSHIDVFTFTESITTPIKILQQLGVDVFTNHRFDTMVLHTIWTRLANNKAGSFDPKRGFVDEISPHLPLFNHSCEPNVEWKRGDGSTTIWFFAKKQVKKGEELFSSYLDVKGMSLEERTEGLWPWFEGVCLCSKCVRERAASQRG